MWLLAAALASAVPHSPCDDHVVPADFDPNSAAGMDLSCADLRDRDLSGANFAGANLTGAWFHAADLTGANFAGASMRFAHLEGATLRDANLEGAFLRRAVLRGTDVYDAVLDGADLCWVDVTNTLFLTAASTEGTHYCSSTELPDELETPEDYNWHFKPFFRPPRETLVSITSLDGLSLVQYSDFAQDNASSDALTIFDDIGATVGVDVIGMDLVPPFLDASHRHWLSSMGFSTSLGFGASQSNNVSFTFVNTNIGVFARPLSFAQLEGGMAVGFTLNNAFEDKVDTALYVGVRINVTPLIAFLDDIAETIW